MKTLNTRVLFFVFLSSLGLSVSAQANETCLQKLKGHIATINESEEFISGIAAKEKDITSYEITRFQHNLELRYKSLKDMQAFYDDEANKCPTKIVSTAVAVYDYTRVGASVFAHKTLRRVLNSFTKYDGFNLTGYKADYKKFTKNRFVKKIIKTLSLEGIVLPEEVTIGKTSIVKKPKTLTPSDIAFNVAVGTVAGVARVWGYISDHLMWRDGRLNKNEEAKQLILSTIRPLDLVFEKRSFTLSNLTIPGHWGHVAVWLGTKEELQAIGVWDQDFFKTFQAQVEAGKNIVEIRKEGLVFKTLDVFLNLDEIAISRVDAARGNEFDIIKELTLQIDKKYDFRFDAFTVDRITCTELITFTFGDIKWDQSKTLFQVNITPDNIARGTVGKNANSEFVLYLKGTKKKELTLLSHVEWSTSLKVKDLGLENDKQLLASNDIVEINQETAAEVADILKKEELELEQRKQQYHNDYGYETNFTFASDNEDFPTDLYLN